MELRRELFLSIGTLVVLNLGLAFGTIGVLLRMGPAIERILQENVFSIVAAEDALTEFALSGGLRLEPEARVRVNDALNKAKHNVTEVVERPVLERLERVLPSAMEGDIPSRLAAVASLRDLIHINREAMREVDREARRLGSAGAWTAVFIGFLSFLLSLVVVVRLRKRVVQPLMDLQQVLEGDRLRRCRAVDAPREVIQVAQAVNRLLDESLVNSTRTLGAPKG